MNDVGSERDIGGAAQEGAVPVHAADGHAVLAAAERARAARRRGRRVPPERAHGGRRRGHRHQERRHALLDPRKTTVHSTTSLSFNINRHSLNVYR